jgi:DNA-binding SARP family transcriptional activator/tetratricopeptide (TPR) repeat protein
LIGHPEVLVGGRPVTLPTRKALLLLALLAVDGAQTRDRLTALLWAEADEARGRTNLRRTIAYLRDGIGREHDALVVAGDSLAPPAQLRSDVELVRNAGVGSAGAATLAAAAATWRGEFLEGLQPEGEELDVWVGQQREVWHRRLASICERLAGLQSDGGDSAQGLETVERWLARDPLAEPAHRLRVRLHLERDDRAAALDAYAVCEQLLASELGIEPSAATRALLARARSKEPPAMSLSVSRSELPIVGRSAEHAVLVGALRRAKDGDPQLVLLAGEPGIGKTRLAVEFASWARAADADVLHGRAFPSSAKLMYQALVEALGRRLETGALPLPGEPWRSELARILPQLGRPRRNSAAGDQPLFEAAARLLRSLAAERPLVLVIDDLQWLDSDSLALLAYAASALESERWLLLLTVRDDELDSRSQLRDWVATVARTLFLTRVQLQPLPAEDSARLLELWPQPIRNAPEGLLEQAAGRPLLIVETLRYLSASGDPAALAPAVRESMQARLRALGPPQEALVEAAAVLERAVSADVLARVAGLDPAAVDAALDDLLRLRILVAADGWSFSHEMLRRAAYESLSHERRRRLHARASSELDSPGHAAEVARHAELAGDLDLAWERRLQAGRSAMEVPAYRVAAEHFAAAIAVRPGPSQVWLDLGRAQELSERTEVAAATYRALLDRARRTRMTGLEAAALVRLGELEGRLLSRGRSDALLEEAGEAAAEAGDVAIELETALAAAQVMAYRMQLAHAQKEAHAALRRARRLERPPLVARGLNLLGFVHQMQGRMKLCVDVSRRAAAAYAVLGEDLMRIDSEEYAVVGLVFGGHWKTGLRRSGRLMQDARRHQNPWAVSHVSLGLAWALYEAGRLDDVREVADEGVESARRAGFLPLQVLNAAVAGRARRHLADIDSALQLHRRAWEWAQSLNALALQAIAEEICADLAALGRWPEAAEWAAESRRCWGEGKMFVHLDAWRVADAILRAGGEYELPDLAEGERYRLTALRVEAVLERHAGRMARSHAVLRDARALAERLELSLQLAELDVEIAEVLSGR